MEGSIVAQSINEETSNFSAYYFPQSVQTKSRKPSRYDDGGEKPQYLTPVPDIFSQVGRLSGKRSKRWLTEEEVKHLHTYILLNCVELLPYERYILLICFTYTSFYLLFIINIFKLTGCTSIN